MGLALLLLFLTIPLVEIAVFIQVGGWIGLWPTIALVIVTAILGSWQLRLQGLATLARARQQMDRGEIPAKELFDGLCLVAAGALLLTPGFVTDLAGAALFVPQLRDWLRRRAGRFVEARARTAGGPGARPGSGPEVQTRIFIDGEELHTEGAADPHSRWGRPSSAGPRTIEGDWREVSEEPPGREQGSDDKPEDLPPQSDRDGESRR